MKISSQTQAKLEQLSLVTEFAMAAGRVGDERSLLAELTACRAAADAAELSLLDDLRGRGKTTNATWHQIGELLRVATRQGAQAHYARLRDRVHHQ